MNRPVRSEPRPRSGGGAPWPSWAAATAWSIAAALGATFLLAVTAGLVDLLGDGDDTTALLVVGGAAGLMAAVIAVWVRPPDRIRDADVLCAFAASLVLFIGTVTGLFLLVDPATSLVDALFRAGTSATTTALEANPVDPADHAVRFLVGGAQWLGGIGALLLAVAVLPFFGAGREFADRSRRGGRRPMAPDPATAVRHLFVVHGLASAFTLIGFLLVGVAPLDAVLLAMATASTGGLVSSPDLESAGAQWVAVIGMAIAGTSLVVLWRLGVGRVRSLLRSAELQAYLGLLIVGSILFLLWTDGSGVDGIRRAAFTVTAAVTTTGFPSTPGGNWAPAAPVLLLGLVSIGPMTGSVGGGFQILRHRILARVATRELLRQLHPRAVIPARLGGRIAAEDTLARVVVTQFLFVSVLFLTAAVVASAGLELATALGAAVHAISTAGPVRTLDGTLVDVGSWPAGVRLALLPAMVVGRLSVYPAIVALGAGMTLIRDRVRFRRRLTTSLGRTTGGRRPSPGTAR